MKKFLATLLTLAMFGCSTHPAINLGKSVQGERLVWPIDFTESVNEYAQVEPGDWDLFVKSGWKEQATVTVFIDSNRDGECDIEAKFRVIEGDYTSYRRYSFPYVVYVDYDFDFKFDFRYAKFNPNSGISQECLPISKQVPVIYYNKKKGTNTGFQTYGIEHFIPFVMIIAVAAVIFKTDKRVAK